MMGPLSSISKALGKIYFKKTEAKNRILKRFTSFSLPTCLSFNFIFTSRPHGHAAGLSNWYTSID